MSYSNNQEFSTKDQDNDNWLSVNCAEERHGAFWYGSCGLVNLNGEYVRNGASSYRGVGWQYWKNNDYSMKRVEMKIRPN